MNRAFVRGLLVEEAFAYGFTIAFWGCGLLVVEAYGLLDTAGVLSYAVGAITGFGALAALTFGGVFTAVEGNSSPSYVVSAGIHYVSSLVPIVVTHYILAAGLGKYVSLFCIGVVVSVLYNVFTMFEEAVSEYIRRLERQYA